MLGRHPRSPFLWPGARLGCWSRGALPASSPASRPHPTRGSFLAGAHLLRPRPQVLPCPALPCPPLYWAPRAAQDHQGAGAAAVCPTGSLGLISAVLGSCQRPLQDRDLSAVPPSRSASGERFLSLNFFFFFLKPELIYNVPSITLVQLYIHLPSFSFHTLLPLSRSNARGRALFRVLPSRTHHLLVFNVTSCIYQLQTPCQSLLSLPLESKGCSP